MNAARAAYGGSIGTTGRRGARDAGLRRGGLSTTDDRDARPRGRHLGRPRRVRHGGPISAPPTAETRRGATLCVTPRQTCPRPSGLGRNLRSKTRWFTGFCNSHQVSHFATFFIDARAEISIAESRSRFRGRDAVPLARGRTLSSDFSLAPIAPGLLFDARGAPAGGGIRGSRPFPRPPSVVVSRVRGSFCSAGFDNDPSAGSPTETLLRLLLPLNDKVQWTSRDVAGGEPPTSPRSEHFTGPFNR